MSFYKGTPTKQLVREAVARAWCKRTTAGKIMDITLVEAIAQEVAPLLVQARGRISKLEDALIWCSASNDFAHPNGVMRQGWDKFCHPLLEPGSFERGVFIEIGLG